MKLTIILLLLLGATAVRAQDSMAKWKPSVGDKFIYQEVYINSKSGGFNDTVTETIVSIDDSMNDSHAHVVHAVNARGDTVRFLDISPVDTSSAMYSFKVFANVATNAGCLEDMSKIAPSAAHVDGRELVVLDPDPYGFEDFAYSPTIHWIYRTYWQKQHQGTQYEERSIVTLIAASQLRSGVQVAQASHIVESFSENSALLSLLLAPKDGTTMDVVLLDPLGRPVRYWQLATSDGPREITLNVSDVPSGVYFLRLKGSGVDEIKRVAIVH